VNVKTLVEGDAMKTPEEQAAATNAAADETTNGVPVPSMPALKSGPPFTKAEFEVKNARRHELIDKKYNGGGLTDEEGQELERLQKETGEYIDAIFPLPFEMIEKLKELARKDGISLEGFPE
jgi:hypothetical protein